MARTVYEEMLPRWLSTRESAKPPPQEGAAARWPLLATGLDETMEIMGEWQVGRLPVVDHDNRLVGIVSLGSLALRSRQEAETLHAAQAVSQRSARAA